MPPMRTNGSGPYLVQYTNAAREQLGRLDNKICMVVQEKFSFVAAVDPYAHGIADPPEAGGERRLIVIEGLLVTFWISAPVKVLTVVDIREGDHDTGEAQPEPPPPSTTVDVHRPGPFPPDEDDEEQILVGPAVGAGS